MPNLHLPALGASNLLPFLRRSIVPAARAPQIDRSLPIPLPLAGPSLLPARTGNTPKPTPLPRLSAAAALAHDARGAVTSLQLLSGLLAAPGVLDSNFSGYAADLEAITAVLTSLVSRIPTLEKIDGAVAHCAFGRIPRGPPRAWATFAASVPQQQARLSRAAAGSCGL